MKLKKKHFKKLKEIAVAVNQIVPGTGILLDKLIAEIESVQKVKEEFALIDIDQLRKDVVKQIVEKPLRTPNYPVPDSVHKEMMSDVRNQNFREFMHAPDTDPKIGDVGYFSTGSPSNHITYSRIRNYTDNKYQDIHGDWYVGCSSTPPELK